MKIINQYSNFLNMCKFADYNFENNLNNNGNIFWRIWIIAYMIFKKKMYMAINFLTNIKIIMILTWKNNSVNNILKIDNNKNINNLNKNIKKKKKKKKKKTNFF